MQRKSLAKIGLDCFNDQVQLVICCHVCESSMPVYECKCAVHVCLCNFQFIDNNILNCSLGSLGYSHVCPVTWAQSRVPCKHWQV